MFKLNEIAVKIEQTNLPDKSENCLAKTLTTFILSKPARRATYSLGGGVISSIGKCFAYPIDEWEIETSSAKVRLIQLFDAQTICSADLKNACHLQPKVGDPADTYSNKLGGKYNQLIVIHICHSPLLRERGRVRGQSKISFPLQTRKKGGVNRIGLLLPLQIGKEVGVNKIGLLSLLQAWKWGVKYD